MRAYVGVGANLGDRAGTIRRAVERLSAAADVTVVAVSTLRETDPWGPVAQPPYLNGVVELETGLGPRALLQVLLEVERELGRVRSGERWGPRTIDLDLLVQGVTSNRDLADRMFVSENTVKYHLRNILYKLHLKNRAQVVAYAMRHGLVDPNKGV